MSSDYTGSIIRAVIEASEGDSWEEARHEWCVNGCWEDEGRQTACLCGHDGLRWCYEIRSVVNGNVLSPVGSECIKKFEDEGMDHDLKMEAQANALMAEAVRLGKGEKVSLWGGKFSRKLLWYLYEQGAFPDNKWNDWDGYNDYRFLLDMFNRGYGSESQLRKVHVLIEKAVYPWLRERWKEQHARGQSRRDNPASS